MPTYRLALDLGTTSGFCIGQHDGALISGTWNFKPGRYDGGGMRFVRFRKALDELYATMPFSIVHFEEVRAHKGVDAAHVYGGLMATLQAWCEERSIPYGGVSVQDIKKFATGKGNASKDDMIAAMRALKFEPVDDNQADAIALWLCQGAAHD